MKKKLYKSLRGATIIELLITVLMLYIVMSISIPSLNAYAASSSLKNEAKRIATLLELCMVRAMIRGETVVLKQHSYELIARSTLNPKKPLLRRVIRGGIDIKLGRPEIKFYSSGTTTPTSVRLSFKSHHCVVRLSLRGRANLDCDTGAS